MGLSCSKEKHFVVYRHKLYSRAQTEWVKFELTSSPFKILCARLSATTCLKIQVLPGISYVWKEFMGLFKVFVRFFFSLEFAFWGPKGVYLTCQVVILEKEKLVIKGTGFRVGDSARKTAHDVWEHAEERSSPPGLCLSSRTDCLRQLKLCLW